jgi:hypothetical protein
LLYVLCNDTPLLNSIKIFKSIISLWVHRSLYLESGLLRCGVKLLVKWRSHFFELKLLCVRLVGSWAVFLVLGTVCFCYSDGSVLCVCDQRGVADVSLHCFTWYLGSVIHVSRGLFLFQTIVMVIIRLVYEVLTAAWLYIMVFWAVIPTRIMLPPSPTSNVKMEAACYPETLVLPEDVAQQREGSQFE